MSCRVRFSPEAEADLLRLFDHVLARELASETGDPDLPQRAIETIEHACQLLAISPFSCRKAGDSPWLRELVIPFGGSGFVALFEILPAHMVLVGAVRHQRESDYL